jgi:hypothetical protein
MKKGMAIFNPFSIHLLLILLFQGILIDRLLKETIEKITEMIDPTIQK